jgi:leucyl aminopeptidase
MKLARDLGNLPSNVCTPSYLADRARSGKNASSRSTVAHMERLAWGPCFPSGSRQPPRFIIPP